MTATDRAGFLAAILADPDDDNPRLAYADALRESPDAHDRAHGEFLWAGLALARFRGHEPVADGTFFDAIRAQAEAAPAVLGAQLRALFGWAAGEWAWDADPAAPDRVTAARIPAPVADETPRERRARRRSPAPREAVVWERGCVAAVRLPLAECIRLGGATLGRCPVQAFHATDAPGLTLLAAREAGGGWRAGVTLDLPKLQQVWTAGGAILRDATPAATVARVSPSVADGPDGIGRGDLASAWPLLARALTAEARDLAGDRWPGPADWPDAPGGG